MHTSCISWFFSRGRFLRSWKPGACAISRKKTDLVLVVYLMDQYCIAMNNKYDQCIFSGFNRYNTNLVIRVPDINMNSWTSTLCWRLFSLGWLKQRGNTKTSYESFYSGHLRALSKYVTLNFRFFDVPSSLVTILCDMGPCMTYNLKNQNNVTL